MQTPLTPLDFARRTRLLCTGARGRRGRQLRLTYEQFFDRCDRWSAALQGLGVRQGDRVRPSRRTPTRSSSRSTPCRSSGAVLVPVNYRLTADDFVYIVNHSGATVVCVHSDYLDAVDGVRDQMPGVRHFVALEGARDGWLDYEAAIAAAEPDFARPEIGERDLLTINYTSGTTARPKGVMITHRNAAMNPSARCCTCRSRSASRYLWTLPMFHANGWTYTWTVTAAAGTHVCLRKVEPATVFRLISDEHVAAVRGADRADLAGQRAGGDARRGAPRRARRSPRGRRRRPRRSSGSRASSAGRSPRSTASPRPRRSSPSARRCPSTRTCRRPSGRSSRRGRAWSC